MNINTPKNNNFSKGIKNKLVSLGIVIILLTGLSACSPNEQNNKISKTDIAEYYEQKNNSETISKNKAETSQKIPKIIENTYNNLLNHRGETCYIIKWIGEDRGEDNPEEDFFLSKEDILDFYVKEKKYWKIIPTKLTDEIILEKLEEYAMLDRQYESFWNKKIEEFKKTLEK